MTYLIPDDWALNHGIAPGDARGPQPPPEPFPQWAGDQDGMWGGNASKGLKPAPPFRGYFGAPPARPVYDTRTQSPFAVPDGLWTQGVVPLKKLHGEGTLGPVFPRYTGVQGLGSFGELSAQQAMEKAAHEMKQAAMESAAAQTAIAIGLNFIPVLGTAVSIVVSVIGAITGAMYQRRAQQVLADLELNLSRLAAAYQAKLQVVKMAVFDQEKGAAIQLALSGATLEGLGSLGFSFSSVWKKAVNPVHHLTTLMKIVKAPAVASLKLIQKVTPDSVDRIIQKPMDEMDRVDKELERAEDKVNEKLATLSGEQQLIIARERASQAYAAASKDMDAQYQAAVLNVQSPQYRAALQVVIAKIIRSDPNMVTLIDTLSSTQAQSMVARVAAPGGIVPQRSTPEKAAMSVVPLIGAVVAFFALGGSK